MERRKNVVIALAMMLLVLGYGTQGRADAPFQDAGHLGMVGTSNIPPSCIIYLQPHPSNTGDPTLQNPLYTDVKNFLASTDSKNEEKVYPPHVSMIGFFPCPNKNSVTAIKNSITQTLNVIGHVLGRPIVEDLTNTITKAGKRTVRLTLSAGPHTSSYFANIIQNVRTSYPPARGATNFPVNKYHITLALGNYTIAEILDIQTQAQIVFLPLSKYNVNVTPQNAWDIVLYQKIDNTFPLVQLQRWRINPTLITADANTAIRARSKFSSRIQGVFDPLK